MTTEADEVAEDYRLALEDLNANMRFEISNLTVIARENTEHALVIAQVLEKHILKVGGPLDGETVLRRATARADASSSDITRSTG
jgi:hypothetical protein